MIIVYYLIFLGVSFFASVVGAICGIGGGVLMKPLLDACGVLSVSAISFLSGLTVLSMSCYSVLKAKISGDTYIDKKVSTFLGIGAAIGGVIGKAVFQYLIQSFSEPERVGAVQAGCLLVITLGTMLYTINQNRIRTYHIDNPMVCSIVGFLLGVSSSFLGIGGGPINLVVLFFFFSMNMKTAAQNSLYIILLSQLTSLIHSIITASIPSVELTLAAVMVVSGILGGALGRVWNRTLDERRVSRLFILLMCGIMLICCYNMYRFLR